MDKVQGAYASKKKEITPTLVRELEWVIMLRVVDEYWIDHIDAMTELRQGIGLRAYAQTDPMVAYKEEGYEMFQAMVDAIQEETVHRLFLVRLRQTEENRKNMPLGCFIAGDFVVAANIEAVARMALPWQLSIISLRRYFFVSTLRSGYISFC